MTSRWTTGLWLLLGTLLVTYAAPWLIGPSAALTYGGYDLAEWSSLPPGVRQTAPPLVTTFLLRFVLTLLTLWLAFASSYRRLSSGWLLVAVGALALVAAQAPPFEFLTVARGDVNYGQQAALTLVSFIGMLVGLMLPPSRWKALIAAALAAAGAVVTIAGVMSAQALFAGYEVEANIGASPVLAAILFGVAALWCAVRFVRLTGRQLSA